MFSDLQINTLMPECLLEVAVNTSLTKSSLEYKETQNYNKKTKTLWGDMKLWQKAISLKGAFYMSPPRGPLSHNPHMIHAYCEAFCTALSFNRNTGREIQNWNLAMPKSHNHHFISFKKHNFSEHQSKKNALMLPVPSHTLGRFMCFICWWASCSQKVAVCIAELIFNTN